ncbi:MAG: M42 family metallopeptidase [Bacillota bacterium]|nr:M42 family metallopeptidase [Bacillota bacterium]
MDLEVKEFLEKVTAASGVSGFEGTVASLIREAWAPLADEIRTDTMGSLIARRAARADGGPAPRPAGAGRVGVAGPAAMPGPEVTVAGEGSREARGRGPLRVMMAAHMDEIGLMVSKIEEGGFLRFTTVGGFDRRVLPAQEVLVHGREDLPGVIGVKPPHLLPREEAEKPYKMEDMYIDVGLEETRVRDLVRVGDPITVGYGCRSLQEELVAGKGMDDRAGVATLHACLQELARLRHPHDVFLVATVQEEVGLKGAVTSAYGIAPDVGVAVDVEFAEQPGLPEDLTVELDKGPVIAVGPNIHPYVFSVLEKVAKEEGIPHQVRVVPGRSGTDAWAIQVTREGIPTGLIGIPLRYMHTSVEVASVADIKRAGRLLARFAMALDAEALAGWRWEA